MRRYEDPQKTCENRLPPRAWYIPEGAARFIPLNGLWDFAFFPDGDREETPAWNKIPVPSCWQRQGFEHPNYSNVNYPFPVDPPYVPDIDPMGLYRRTFTWTDEDCDLYLVLEGASSCAEVTLNGREAGFTQGSHLFAEFDLTPYAVPGENELCIRVRKWCCGSYLEDQDAFRYSGLFRDVYLLSRPKGHLFDLEIRTEGEEILCRAGGAFLARVLDGDKVIAEGSGAGEVRLRVPSPRLWTAETPDLYTVEVEAAGEVIRQKTGFRTVTVGDDHVFRVNGRPVKLLGVNHHDTHPENGWTMTEADVEKDLRLMKKLNINAVRTSHYPPMPCLLRLCDELGLYVILETDIETHGFAHRDPAVPGYQSDHPDWPCGDPKWEKEFVDRMRRAYERDKNHPCVVLWSTGNESSFGKNQRAMIRWLKERDPAALTHSEDASRQGFAADADVYSRMYLAVPELVKAGKEQDRPVFLCEYAHAMGNGPGGVGDYVDAFFNDEKCMGGCIWEWADHVVLENGVQKYGGDFPDEPVQDGNFCCDGMVFADRSLKAGSWEIRAAYAPFAACWDGEKLTVTNRYAFLSFSHLTFTYRIARDGETLEEKEITNSALPGESFEITPEKPLPGDARYGLFITLTARDGSGEEIATLQKEIPVRRLLRETGEGLCPREEAFSFVAEGKGFRMEISKRTGGFVSLRKDGKELLCAPAALTAFRPVTDNERDVRHLWDRSTHQAGENLDRIFNKVYGYSRSGNVLSFEMAAAGVGRVPFFRYTLSYAFFADGAVRVTLSGRVREDAVWLQRLGFAFTLPRKFDRFSYFGNGPWESYRDMALHGTVDWHASAADREYVPYVRPQEHGNHYDCRALKMEGAFAVEAEDTMEICVLRHSPEAIEKANHTDELTPSPFTHLRVDYKDSGMGSASCGPDLPEIYRLREKDIRFSFTLSL